MFKTIHAFVYNMVRLDELENNRDIVNKLLKISLQMPLNQYQKQHLIETQKQLSLGKAYESPLIEYL